MVICSGPAAYKSKKLLTVVWWEIVPPILRFLRSCGDPPYCPEICFRTSAATVLEQEKRWYLTIEFTTFIKEIKDTNFIGGKNNIYSILKSCNNIVKP